MNKIPFENGTLVTPAKVNEDNTITPALYEGTTPLTSHNLNLLQDNIESEIINSGVVINSTELTDDRKKVWLQKTKNLFDKNNKLVVNGSPSSSMVFVISATKLSRSVILRCEPNSTYTISKIVTTAFAVASSEEFPVNNGKITVINTNHNAESITITTGENDKYLLIQYMHTENDTLTENEILNTLQVEQGSTATNYEKNVTSAIYTKNNNDEYEKFSETVAISSHQPTNQNGLWLQKGKNLFNSATQIDDVRLNSTNGSLETYEGRTTSAFIKVEPNTDYIFSINGVATDINLYEYKNDGSFIKFTVASSITTSESTGYIRFYGSTNNLVNVQVEQGSTVTDYEEYKESKIYTKNDNGVYEEFLKVNNTEDFSNKVTFNETPVNISFLKNGNVVEITYQGEAKTHSANTLLFTLPEKYRPTIPKYFPFVKNADAYGVIILASDGNCVVNQINSTTANGRIYFTVTYIV